MNQGCLGSPVGAGGIVNPGDAKAFVKFVYDSTSGALKILGESYNVRRLVRNGVGDYTIEFQRAFLHPHFVCLMSCKQIVTSISQVSIHNADPGNGAVKRLIALTLSGGTINANDLEIHFAAWGLI